MIYDNQPKKIRGRGNCPYSPPVDALGSGNGLILSSMLSWKKYLFIYFFNQQVATER